MAIWQHKIYLLPKEEIESYFGNKEVHSIDMKDLDSIDWWKYRCLNDEDFDVFSNILKKEDSWSESIIQYGDLESTCIELILEDSKIVEISARIDFTKNNEIFVKKLIDFTIDKDLIILSYSKKLKIIYPNEFSLKEEINNSKIDYNSFLDFLNK